MTLSTRLAHVGAPRLRLLGGAARDRAEVRGDRLAGAGQRDGARLTSLVVAMTVFGLVIVLSASSVISIADYGSPWSLFERQVMWTAMGAVAFVLGRRANLRHLRRLAVPILAATLFLLVVVLAPHLGTSAGGSSRWIGAGPLRLQPSELAKFAFALFAADLVARREHHRDHLHSLVKPVLLVLGLSAVLILKQPDMGTAIVLCCIAAALLYSGGVHHRLLLSAFSLLALGGIYEAFSAPYRRARFLSFINPFAHAATSGYQVAQSLAALGSGHLVGAGLGGSVAKWGFLPNAQTDFIYAVIGNELGLLGTLAVLLAFAGIGALGFRIAARSMDRFSCLLATAITCWIVCQAFINIGGVISILPETGIPLPLLSSGGSSLVVTLGALGILVNIARQPSSLRTDAARRPSPATALPPGAALRPALARTQRAAPDGARRARSAEPSARRAR